MNNRRLFPRAALKEPIQFQLKTPTPVTGALSCDISEGGVRVKLSDFVPVGAELILQAQLSPTCSIECVGRVKWVSQIPFTEWYQAGVEFVETDSIVPVRNRIHEFVHRAL